MIRPHFTKSTARDKFEMLFLVILNFVVIVFCLTYLVTEFRASGIGWSFLFASVIIGYLMADFASGLVHWGADTWFSEETLGRAIAIAREHHTHPQNILGYGFLEHAALGSGPSAAVVGVSSIVLASADVTPTTYSVMIILTVTALCLLFGTQFHNLGHRRSGAAIILALQKAHLIMTPGHHWVHHRNQQIRYCTVNGWANPVCDAFGVWRGLEWVVHRLTGAIPRENDAEWQRIFKESGQLTSPSSDRRRSFGPNLEGGSPAPIPCEPRRNAGETPSLPIAARSANGSVSAPAA